MIESLPLLERRGRCPTPGHRPCVRRARDLRRNRRLSAGLTRAHVDDDLAGREAGDEPSGPLATAPRAAEFVTITNVTSAAPADRPRRVGERQLHARPATALSSRVRL